MGTATMADVLACFRLLLGREPHPEEWPGHFGMTGAPLDEVVRSYLNSLEFRQRGLFDTADSADIVRLERFGIYVASDDQLIAPAIRSGSYEPNVTQEIEAAIRPGTAAIDIGANCGYFSLLACSHGVAVYAFEPFQRNVRMLMASRALNGYGSLLRVIAAAASDAPQTLTIGAAFTNAIVGHATDDADIALTATYVPAVLVDDCVPPDADVRVLKIDVEGHEYPALCGAMQTIRRCRPVLVSEFGPAGLEANSGRSGREYLTLIRSAGYSTLRIAGSREPLTNEQIMERTHGVDHVDIVASV